jgi:predicted transcriptional regulator
MSNPFNLNRRFTPTKTGDAAPLGQLEQAVMSVMWASSTTALSVSEVHSALSKTTEQHTVAYTTVKTTMERLADKGILVQIRSGKAYQYRAALTEEDLERRIVSSALDKLVADFPQAVASFFVRPDPSLSDDQLALLKE